MTGHLFVTRGDLTELACDAVLVPSGSWWRGGRSVRGHVMPAWRDLVQADAEGIAIGAEAASEVDVWCQSEGGWPQPAVWIGHTGGDDLAPADLVRVLQRFVMDAAERARRAIADSDRRPLADRRPLLGVPLIGTGAGGLSGSSGLVMKDLIASLREAVRTADADVVLVLRDAQAYSAAQQERERHGEVSGAIREDLQASLARLVDEARRDRLVLFLGAGVSMGAGLPSWSDLINQLLARAELDDQFNATTLNQLDPRDVASLIARRVRKRGSTLGSTVAELLTAETGGQGRRRVSLHHQLLASLPTKQAVTTNYDALYEGACHGAGRTIDVLPGQDDVGPDWLLKLHGSVDQPSRIVLSRDDYLRLEEGGTALAGIVHAMLLTRHLLFVGYSLRDDNFHRIVHQVRAVSAPTDGERKIGTVLSPEPSSVLHEIWQPEITYASTAQQGRSGVREQAIFLDCLAAMTSFPASHLLDERYRHLFTDREQQLRSAIAELGVFSTDDRVRPSLQQEVRWLLERFGAPRAGRSTYPVDERWG